MLLILPDKISVYLITDGAKEYLYSVLLYISTEYNAGVVPAQYVEFMLELSFMYG